MSAFETGTGAVGATGATGPAGVTGATGPSGSTKLFDSTLGGDAASIDTGAAGIAGGYDVLEVFVIARTSEAVVASTVGFRFNNDSGSNYDVERVLGQNITVTAAQILATTSAQIQVPGDSAQADTAGSIDFVIPGYTQTTFHKAGVMRTVLPEDTAAEMRVDVRSFRWRSTAAISRMAVVASSGNLRAGSRLLIYGR